MASGNKKSLRQTLLLFLLLTLAAVLWFYNSEEQQPFSALTPQQQDKSERALKQLLTLHERIVAPVTNKWIEATNAARTPSPSLEELKPEIEKLRWILARGVRGEENEVEISERLRLLEKQHFETLIENFRAKDAALSREDRQEQLKRFQADYEVNVAKLRAAETAMLRAVRNENLTKEQIQDAFDASAEGGRSDANREVNSPLFKRMKDWRFHLNLVEGLANRIRVEEQKLGSQKATQP